MKRRETITFNTISIALIDLQLKPCNMHLRKYAALFFAIVSRGNKSCSKNDFFSAF